MKTHRILGIAVTGRRIAIAMLLLMVSVALITLAPSRVHLYATTGPAVPDDYGFAGPAYFFSVDEAKIDADKILDLDGSLWEWTGVRLKLVFVRSGVAQSDECQIGMGTKYGHLTTLFSATTWRGVALGRVNTTQGSFAFLGSCGMPGGGKWPTHAPCRPAKVKKGYDRNIKWSSKEIVYVEGNEKPVVFPGMSLEEICTRNNRGEYLVVIASLRSP